MSIAHDSNNIVQYSPYMPYCVVSSDSMPEGHSISEYNGLLYYQIGNFLVESRYARKFMGGALLAEGIKTLRRMESVAESQEQARAVYDVLERLGHVAIGRVADRNSLSEIAGAYLSFVKTVSPESEWVTLIEEELQ